LFLFFKVKPTYKENVRSGPSTYTAPTVSSRIREKPPVIEKAVTPKKNVAFNVDNRTLRERDEDIVRKIHRFLIT